MNKVITNKNQTPQTPLVSVIMCVYNGGIYLSEAIESILNQTYTNFELIIINDGSTDQSLEVITKYKNQDKRIVLISRENKGISYSSNQGIERSVGKYIAKMDADDISLPTRFEDQIKLMESNESIGACGGWIENFGKGRKSTISKIPFSQDDTKVRLLFTLPVLTGSAMFRKKVIMEHNLRFKNILLEDYKFLVEFSRFSNFANIPKVLLRYRYLETSETRRIQNQEKTSTYYKCLRLIFTEVLENLRIVNTEDENKLHFILIDNQQASKTHVDLNFLNRYLNKIIKANDDVKFFNSKSLKKILARRFLVIVFYKIKRFDISFLNAMFYTLFWYGVINLLITNVISRTEKT